MPRVKGERKLEILKALAEMLEAPRGEKVTTAALAAKLDVSEAALYRHFASKAQMFEGLIEFIENSVFTLANKITADEADGTAQAGKLVEMLLAFAEKNPGMVRVMTGDALVGEHERLQARMNQFFDRFESTLKQALRAAADSDAAARAATLLRYAIGCAAPVREKRLREETHRGLRGAAGHALCLTRGWRSSPAPRAASATRSRASSSISATAWRSWTSTRSRFERQPAAWTGTAPCWRNAATSPTRSRSGPPSRRS